MVSDAATPHGAESHLLSAYTTRFTGANIDLQKYYQTFMGILVFLEGVLSREDAIKKFWFN